MSSMSISESAVCHCICMSLSLRLVRQNFNMGLYAQIVYSHMPGLYVPLVSAIECRRDALWLLPFSATSMAFTLAEGHKITRKQD